MILGRITAHLDVIGSVATLLGSGIAVINSLLEKKHKGITILGGVIALTGGVLTLIASQSSSHSQAIRQQQEAERQQQILQNATAINTQVSDAASKLKALQDNLGDEKDAVSDLTDDVDAGTKQVLGATKQVTDAITGGKAYCYVALVPELIEDKSNVLRVHLLNPGSKPAFDVSYSIMKALPPNPSLAEVKTALLNQKSGFSSVVFGGPGNGLLSPTPIEVSPGEYVVHIYMRNGEIAERVREEFDGKNWIEATVVKRAGKTLKSYNPQNLSVPF